MKRKVLLVTLCLLISWPVFAVQKFKIPTPATPTKKALPAQTTPIKKPLPKLDARVLRMRLISSCPEGQSKFYQGSWDVVGYCATFEQGIPRHCLNHFLYVSEANGSMGADSNCSVIWNTRDNPGSATIHGKAITGGFECIKDPNAVAFTAPPPDGACPSGASLSSFSNQLQYCCSGVADAARSWCKEGYAQVITDTQNHSFCCGLTGQEGSGYDGIGFLYAYQMDDGYEPGGYACGRTPGAYYLVTNSGYDWYCCADTQTGAQQAPAAEGNSP